jgi:cytochrome b561
MIRAMTRPVARVRRHLHWWTAALVVIGFSLAWVMTALPATVLLIKFLLYQAHKTIGLTVAMLAVVRLWLSYWSGSRIGPIEAMLYAMLLVVPLLGYLTAAAAPGGVPTLFLLIVPVPHALPPSQAVFEAIRPFHRWIAIGLIALAAWHAAVRSRVRQGGGRYSNRPR